MARACGLLVILAHTYSQLYFLDGFSLMDIIAVHSVSQSRSTIGDRATRQVDALFKALRVLVGSLK